MEITYDRMKAESHILNSPMIMEYRTIPCHRPICTVIYTQGLVSPDSAKVNREFDKGGITYSMCIHTTGDFVRLRVQCQE